MPDTSPIKTAFERNARAMTLRPSIGRGTAVTTVRLRQGLTCDIEDGSWNLTADLSEKHGGLDEGPNPGVLGRAALGSCLAMTYVRWAAVLDIPLDDVTVEIQADYDARGEFGVADLPPSYEEVRYVVTLVTDAPSSQVESLLEAAEKHTSFLDLYRRSLDVRRVVHLVTPTPDIP